MGHAPCTNRSPPMYPSTKDQLIQTISAAFAEVEYPGDDHLVDQSYGTEPDTVRNHFLGRDDWRKLTHEFLDVDGTLAFLSDRAFRFYLPAFLVADINEKLELNDPTVRLCWSVNLQSESVKLAEVWGAETVGERALACFEAFSKDQVTAIVAYLQWRLAKDEYNPSIEQALKYYWLPRKK